MSLEGISGKKWIQRPADESRVTQISHFWGTSWLVARLVSYRVGFDEISTFLLPKVASHLPEPMEMLGMEEAVACFLEVLSKKQRVCIFADYDVDGATSAALLVRLLSALGLEHVVYVPDRITEGYGLSISALKKFICQVQCIIAVDCGSSSKEEIEFAASCGVKVIVLDHHAVASVPLNAAVVNPNRLDESGKLSYLAAVGVTYLFLFAIVRILRKRPNFPAEFDLLYLLDLVALGTVCDLVPLIGLNRTFVAQGLKVLRLRKNPGLRALADLAKVQGKLTSYHLGFVLGPRINAGSRVGDSSLGVKLLTATSSNAMQIASLLEACNERRIAIERVMLSEASDMARSYPSSKKVLILGSQRWHAGLIGIVASRIKEIYEKPTAVIAWDGDFGKGSCRSVQGFNFGAKLFAAKLNGLICSGGGHYMAAGFTLESSKLGPLEEFLESEATNLASDPISYFDEFLTVDSLNAKLLEELEALAPYGISNQAPIFCLQGAIIKHACIVSKLHVCCSLESREGFKVRAFAFGHASTTLGRSLMSLRSGCLMLSVGEGSFTIKDLIV